MSTNATIAYKDGDEYTAIYLHWDGYFSEAGRILLENYTSLGMYEAGGIEELIQTGDMSQLAPTVDSCTYYGRDKGEAWKGVAPQMFNSLDDLKECAQEYLYIWDDLKAQWTTLYNGEIVPLASAMAAQLETNNA